MGYITECMKLNVNEGVHSIFNNISNSSYYVCTPVLPLGTSLAVHASG